MKPIDVCIGMIKGSLLVVGLLFLLALFEPTGIAAGNYLIRPHQITCGKFSVAVPWSWQIMRTNCDGSVFIQKRTNLLMSSDGNGSLLFVDFVDKRRPLQSAEVIEQEFRNQYLQASIVPYRLNESYTRCLRVDNVPGRDWETVKCIDPVRGINLTFIGTESHLAEIATLVR